MTWVLVINTGANLVAQSVKNLPVRQETACKAGNPGWIPGSGRCPGEGNNNPLQYSCLENLIDKGVWQAAVHGVTRVRNDLATKPPPLVFGWMTLNPQPRTLPRFQMLVSNSQQHISMRVSKETPTQWLSLPKKWSSLPKMPCFLSLQLQGLVPLPNSLKRYNHSVGHLVLWISSPFTLTAPNLVVVIIATSSVLEACWSML